MLRCLRPAAVLAALVSLPLAAAAQRASLQGIVSSASTGSPLEGVAVALVAPGQQLRGTFTDGNGFYQIGGIAPGDYVLRAQLVGYGDYERAVTFAPGDARRVSFGLEPRPVVLEGITVTPRRGAAVRELGRQRLTPKEVSLVPSPAGTHDLAGYLQTLPGVTSTGDRGGQLFVRGGTPAENLVLVDGIPIYHPFHVLGFFSVFPEDLVHSADFYAGGFGARYSGRTSSVLDVRMRDGRPDGYHALASLSPFIAEALVEGPGGKGITWLASARRSLIEETSGTLLGATQPLTFESELLKATIAEGDALRCSALALHTSDRGRLDPEERQSRVGWRNLVVGSRCVAQLNRVLRLLEVTFGYSRGSNTAVSHGSSEFSSSVGRLHHDVHLSTMIGAVPVYAGYQLAGELLDYDLKELYGIGQSTDWLMYANGYLEAAVPVNERMALSPGVVVTLSPRPGVEPRIRASWEPLGRASEKLEAAVGVYRQEIVGTSDPRDVGNVFVAWMATPDGVPMRAVHALVGWQQSAGTRFRWSADAYYKTMTNLPVPALRGLTQFSTLLDPATGKTRGLDARAEYTTGSFYGFVGYGYGWTQYHASQPMFGIWVGDTVSRYYPAHDRRHQLNALASIDVKGFKASARWQFGSGLPFTSPTGFGESFDYGGDLQDVHLRPGDTRMLVGEPFAARLPAMHRLDISAERRFDLPFGRLHVQAGAINVYDRRNIFYYDLFTQRRVDQLPLAPYAALTLRGR